MDEDSAIQSQIDRGAAARDSRPEKYLMGLNTVDQTPKNQPPMEATIRTVEYAQLFVESPPMVGEGKRAKPAIDIIAKYLISTGDETLKTYGQRLELAEEGMRLIARKSTKPTDARILNSGPETQAVTIVGLLHSIERAFKGQEVPQEVEDALAALRKKITPDFKDNLDKSFRSGSVISANRGG